MHNRIKKHIKQPDYTQELIAALIEQFDEVVFVGRNKEHKAIVAYIHGDPKVNLNLIETLKIKIEESI